MYTICVYAVAARGIRDSEAATDNWWKSDKSYRNINNEYKKCTYQFYSFKNVDSSVFHDVIRVVVSFKCSFSIDIFKKFVNLSSEIVLLMDDFILFKREKLLSTETFVD